ncbi:MAG TPA: beta-propeller domain-containing protein [Clostridiales bacterium]|jgi:uncharacterized secreted protein with C-terminal beta-propeller domain|nr:beta-propeller domain-containing protein [Clostridiales bacterium]
MKKEIKETKETIRQKMDSFKENEALPENLAPDVIVGKLNEKEIKPLPKIGKAAVRRIAAMAAALVVVIGAVSVYGFFIGGKPFEFDSSINEAGSKAEIVSLFKQMKKRERRENLKDFRLNFSLGAQKSDTALPEGSMDDGSADNVYDVSGEKDSLFGETNVQVKGVDEPDVLKNDGKYLYIVSTGGTSVDIYSALPADQMKKVASIKRKEGDSYSISYVFVKDKTLAVLGERRESTEDEDYVPGESPDTPYRYFFRYGKLISFCDIYDIGDTEKPKLVKTVEQDGSLITARRVGDELYVLSSYEVDVFSKTLEDDCMPRVGSDGDLSELDVKDINITKDPDPGYLVVSSINLNDPKAEPGKKAVLGGGHEAYCTADGIFVARTVYKPKTEKNSGGDRADMAPIEIMEFSGRYVTEIYNFSIDPGKVEFKNSGQVEGQILNQFSMDKHEGYFRIATTSGMWQNSSSSIFVLNDKLETVGAVKNIAPGERIFGVRFMGEVAYVVTFEQTDPFFIIDLKDPKNPKILGELKIPGFSSYLHPINENLVLGIGQNGDDRGTLPGIKLSLFDVSDPTKPKEADRLIIKGETSTVAMHNHRAFLNLPGGTSFAIPVLNHGVRIGLPYEGITGGEEDGFAAPYEGNVSFHTSFESFEIKDGKIHPLVSYKEADRENSRAYDYEGIYRGTYIGEYVYTVSAAAVTAYNMADGKVLSSVENKDAVLYRDYEIVYD